MKIYAASKTRHAEYWRRLRDSGVNIISTWIDKAGPGQTLDYSELAQHCLNEIRECDMLLIYCVDDDVLKGALIEAGMALALGKPVRCVAPNGRIGIFEQHPQWQHFNGIAEALETPLLVAKRQSSKK